jgi:hypothetical protein
MIVHGSRSAGSLVVAVALVLFAVIGPAGAAAAGPEGQLTWGVIHDKVMYAPIWELPFINGVGPRVEESGLGLIAGHAYSAPYEDLKLKGR